MNAFALTLLLSVSGNAQTPAQKQIDLALEAIREEPAGAAHYSSLAMAFAKRGREAADHDFYERALAATDVALALEPGDLSARKGRTWALLGLHRFQDALDLAQELNREIPDDLGVYGFLVDAQIELGDFDAAVEACQWMLDLRPGNVPGLTRAAYLRELSGDIDGALDLMQQAFGRVSSFEREDQAWILTHVGHLYRLEGRLAEATDVLERALELFPDYHYALAQLGHVHSAAGEAEDAAELFARRYEVAPHPENLFDLAGAVHAAGRVAEANALFARFETEAFVEAPGVDNANRELVLYLVDRKGRAEEALEIAAREVARRGDVLTRDAHAWALFGAGRLAEANERMSAVLATGLVDPVVLYHGGAIAAAAGESEAAERLLRDALERDSGSETSAKARDLLAQLGIQDA